ncbi:hypothetical protein D3C87_881120 [compost metagenome]
MKRSLLPLLICLCCSPLIFAAMYADYFYQSSYFYFFAIIFPILFLRSYKHLLLLFLMSCVVSSVLVKSYLQDTGTFFKPFSQILEVLVITEALIFGIVQVLLVLLINFLLRAKRAYK